MNIRFQLNGTPTGINVEGDRMLLWVLRTELGLTGTKYGCGKSQCGACSVLVDNRVVRSCQFPVRNIDGKEVITIEGLAKNGKLHPLQKAFLDHNAFQCGFCTPGMILNAYGLLLEKPQPSRKQILDHMERNLCRCGAHTRIVQAIHSAAAEMGGR